MSNNTQRYRVCEVQDLIPESGVAVWTPAGPVAIFYLPAQTPSLYAISHHDPFSGANVLARGITGDLKGHLVVASPIYKQHFDLRSGVCLEDDSVRVPTFAVHLNGEDVIVEVPAEVVAAETA
ncbi:nitrite reductase small subunit NirD [Marinobacter salinisoli]|uniref:Nitrite reductase small subunit NirD n=1 Tax=Marinobacter salinisoli TaxID=2769486 RepID=A0ABX7MTK6_9GAMM|nr:nitrite reductase small subunit NirD [Marinobacter salinisoli]QSP95712.1 nitrite reductase small subunit NirD [Marinobacter salinisoli]